MWPHYKVYNLAGRGVPGGPGRPPERTGAPRPARSAQVRSSQADGDGGGERERGEGRQDAQDRKGEAPPGLEPDAYRTIFSRRMMQRLAARVAYKERAQALVTGESLGQVASQTLQNMRLIESASDLPVLRPLIAHDKLEIIERARKLGTFAISTRNEPDCCALFAPMPGSFLAASSELWVRAASTTLQPS